MLKGNRRCSASKTLIATTIVGIELLHRSRKGQFDLGSLHFKNQTVPAIWNAVLAA